MKVEAAPYVLGSMSIDATTLNIALIVGAVLLVCLIGARRELAMAAIMAGVVGVILTV